MRHAYKKPLFIFAGVFVFIVLLFVGVLLYVQSGYFSQNASRYASDYSGRRIQFENRFHLNIGRNSRLVVENLHVGNTDWGKEKDLFSAERIEVAFRILPLFVGRLELPEVILQNPQISLEKNAKGESNWQLTQNAAGAALKAQMPDNRREFPAIGRLKIDKGVLNYHDAARKIDTKLAISTIKGSANKDDEIELKGEGTYEGNPFKLEFGGASVLQLRTNNDPYPFSLSMVVGPTSVEVKGTVKDPVKVRGLDVKLNIKGQNAADLYEITGIALLPTPPYAIRGKLRNEGADWYLDKFSGTMGTSDLAGSLEWHPEQKPRYFKGEFISNNLDMKDLAGFVGAHKNPANPDRVIPDIPMDTSRLGAMNADVVFKGAHIKAPQLIDKFLMDLSLKDGVLNLKPVSFTIEKGTISMNAVLSPKEKNAPAKAEFTFDSISLARLFAPLAKKFGEENVSAGTIGGKATITGTGRSLREILATSNGKAWFGMEGGKISRLVVELAGLDIFKSLGLILSGDKPVTILCGAADFSIDKGVMESSRVLLDTDVAAIKGGGKINLGNEEMNLIFRLYPKDASLISARSPLTVKGTLKHPKAGIDAKMLALRGGVAAVLAVLAPPAALIAFLEPGGEREQQTADCGSLLKQVEKKAGGTMD